MSSKRPFSFAAAPGLAAVIVALSSVGRLAAQGEPAPAGALRIHKDGAFDGYTLLSPLRSRSIRLIDLEGNVVHRWDCDLEPWTQIFLETGNLMICGRTADTPPIRAGGHCGVLQELDWSGAVRWTFEFASEDHLQHHDIEVTPRGTVLFLAWERKSAEECLAAGRDPTGIPEAGLWSECIFEVEPQRPSGGKIVWEWHAWDHLIQDVDPGADRFGDVAGHPELLDVNVDLRNVVGEADDLAAMRALGYVAAAPSRGAATSDWLHMNSIDYHPELDQIVVSSRELSEVFILDHSTTSAEAASHQGGRSRRGGDFLWRWGNPSNHRAGSAVDRQLFGQHDARWVRDGEPGAGNLTIYNNGCDRSEAAYSSVIELALPLREDGTYGLVPGLAAGPAAPVWIYTARNKPDFFSSFVSGAQRLPNGNTLICEGTKGRAFEVTESGDVVWDYVNPFGREASRRTRTSASRESRRSDANAGERGDVAANPGVPRRPRPREERAGNLWSPRPTDGSSYRRWQTDSGIDRRAGSGASAPNGLFRVTRIPRDHPGLLGKTLTPIAE